MRILLTGGDGYLGWPVGMGLAAAGHEVLLVDSYLRRHVAKETLSEPLIDNPSLLDRAEVFCGATGFGLRVAIGDCCDYRFLERAFEAFAPDALIHGAALTSGAYAMMGRDEAAAMLNNDVNAAFNVAQAVVRHAPRCHVVVLCAHGSDGRTESPRTSKAASATAGAESLSDVSAGCTRDLLRFHARAHGVRLTELSLGRVFGLSTDEADMDERLMPNFHYDDIFGTVVNRFLVQAVAGLPLIVYGEDRRPASYLHLREALGHVRRALDAPPAPGEIAVVSGLGHRLTFGALAERVRAVGRAIGLDVSVATIPGLRRPAAASDQVLKDAEPVCAGAPMTDDVIAGLLRRLCLYKDRIDTARILPRVSWAA